MKRGIFLATAAAGAFLFASVAIAQTDQSRNSAIETVIVTGTRLQADKVPMKATFTESTISQEQILNVSPSPATTIQNLLNTEPSIYAVSNGANGMEQDVKFRSFVDGEFGETVAGVPLNDIFNGGVTYQADNRNNVLFITRDLESVDIYRGVNNPAVNTYNSLGGTINFVPRQPTDDMGGDVGIDGGSFNSLDVHARFDTGDWNGIRQTISVERDTSSGWVDGAPDWNNNLYYAGNASFDHTQLFAYFVSNENKGDAPQFIPVNLIDEFGQSYQWPQNIYKAVNANNSYLGITGFKSEITSEITIEDEVYAGDNDYRRTSFSNPAYTGPYFLDDQGSSDAFWSFYGGPPYNPASVFPYSGSQAYGVGTGSGPGQYNCAPDCAFAGTDYHFYGYNGALYGDRLRATFDLPYDLVTIGGDANLGELHSREYWYGTFHMPMIVGYNDAWDEHDTRTMWSAFAQDDIHFWDDRIHITPGLKYIGATSKDNDAFGFYYVPPGSIKGHEDFLSPTIGASVEPFEDFTVYGAYGKNVKFPDITALYNELGFGGAIPPVTAKPEFAQDYELGARYKWEGLQAELDLYQENFTNVLYTYEFLGGFGATEQLNGGAERYRGVELQLTDDLGEFWVGHWKGYLNASYNEAICTSVPLLPGNGNADTGGNCSVGESLANVPDYLLNAGLTWDWDSWHVDLQGHYVGQQHLADWQNGYPQSPSLLEPGQPTKIPDYLIFNVGIVKVVPINWGPANALRFALHVDNLFNKHYWSQAETNSDANNASVGGTQLNDVYANTGEPRAVFGSVSIYF